MMPVENLPFHLTSDRTPRGDCPLAVIEYGVWRCVCGAGGDFVSFRRHIVAVDDLLHHFAEARLKQ